MSLLIKALNKAEEAQAQNAKNSAQAQNAKNSAQAQATKNSAKAEKSKPDQSKVDQTQATENKPKPTVSNKPPSQTSQGAASPVNTDLELSLSPTGSSFSDSATKPTTVTTSPKPAPTKAFSNQHLAAQSAANVFSAKGIEDKTDSTRLALIAGAGLIALLGMGLYFYQFVDNSPPIVVPPRPIEEMSAQTAQTEVVSTPVSEATPLENTNFETTEADMTAALEPTEPILVADKRENTVKKRAKPAVVTEDEFSLDESADESTQAQPSEEPIEMAAATKPSKNTRKSKNNIAIASDSASIQVTKSSSQAGINPVLISAYEAYNAGNDSEAQKLYKQVLKRDIHNVDALLGLGAIAARQGRSADANGWYSKVLEVEPNNNIAKTAMLDSQSEGNESVNETSLKNMLAKRPDDANLHVALGNLYAEQNQWPAAQQAYFDAYSLNKTADNAYNLAVSLDQMGKPKLALPYYQRALEQAGASSNIDKAALEARIAAIQ